MTRLYWFACIMLLVSCGSHESMSRLQASREARYLLEAPADLSPGFWSSLKNPELTEDFLLQRRVGWSLWSELLKPMSASNQRHFMAFQSWYGREDLQRIFRHLYENLGMKGRQERRAFTQASIEEGLRWNNRLQFQDPNWDAKRFEAWFARYDTAEKQRALPGMDKILFNEKALSFLLTNYRQLELCQKERQAQRSCRDFIWPESAVFLKTSWRRSEEGFLVDRYSTEAQDLARQWANPQWTAGSSYEPQDGDSFFIRLPSGQKFHLTGLHASLHADQSWFWTSFWLGPTAGGDFASDQAGQLDSMWDHYRLCSVAGWSLPLQASGVDAGWPEPLQELAALMLKEKLVNWCSNPYLEPGPHNHKTNCVGCHQYAGLNWTQQNFRQRLTQDFPSMIAPRDDPGYADFVWSLFAGPEPLVQPLMDDIEFFDVYDPYQ